MKRVVSLVCLSVIGLVTVASAPRAHADPKKTVAVLGLELRDDGSGIDERSTNVARMLTESLRKRAKAPSSPYGLAPGGDKELVDALVLGGCAKAEDTPCMVSIGGDITTDYLIYGNMIKSGKKDFQVSLTLLDIGKKSIIRQLTDKIDGKNVKEAELDIIGKDLYARLTGASVKGNLVVTSNAQSGQVFVEGLPKGNLVKGQARIDGLPEGRTKIRVESGGAIKEQIVTIDGGETTTVKVDLDQSGDGGGGVGPGGDGLTGTNGLGGNLSTEGDVSEGRPGGGWRKLAIASGIVALAAGGTWIYSYKKIKDYEDKSFMTTDEELIRDYKDKGEMWSTVTFVAGPLTVIAGGACIYSVVRGFIAPGKRKPKEAPGTVTLHKKGRTTITLTPVISPDGVASSFRIDW